MFRAHGLVRVVAWLLADATRTVTRLLGVRVAQSVRVVVLTDKPSG